MRPFLDTMLFKAESFDPIPSNYLQFDSLETQQDNLFGEAENDSAGQPKVSDSAQLILWKLLKHQTP